MTRKKGVSLNSVNLYFKSIRNIPVLNAVEEKELIKKAKEGDRKAFIKIIVANQKLVVKEALKYYFNNNNFLDLVNEGNKGLIEALRRFDINRENRFYTYALWWVRSEIRRYLSKNHKIISFPDIFYNDYLTFKKKYYKMRKRLGRRPSKKELAEEMSLSEKKVNVLLSVPTEIISLDMKLSDEENSADLSSIVPDSSAIDPQAELIGLSTKNLIQQDIHELTEREANVVRLRYGFNNQRPMRLREIAKEMNMSPEGIRRIEIKALKKLKSKLYKQGVYGVLN
jgi:RNA polymerase primary sigma factor